MHQHSRKFEPIFSGEHGHNIPDTQNKILKGQKVLFLLQGDTALHDQLKEIPKIYKSLQPHKSLFFAKSYVVAVQSLGRPIDLVNFFSTL